jgi:alpha-1,2-mannosyltransferase
LLLYRYGYRQDRLYNVDLPSFYLAARRTFTEGSSPYDYVALRDQGAEIGQHVFPFLYPPTSLLALYPLHLLTYGQAKIAMLVANHLLALAMAGLLVLVLVPFRRPELGLLVGAVLLASDPVGQTLAHAQVNLVVLMLLLVAWMGLRAERPVVGGVSLALAILVKPTPILLLGLLLVRRAWRPLAVALGALALAAGASTLVLPAEVWGDWIAEVRPTLAYGLGPTNLFSPACDFNQSLNGLVSRLFLEAECLPTTDVVPGPGRLLAYALALVVVGSSAFAASGAARRGRASLNRESGSLDVSFCLFLLAMFLVGSLSWEHHLVFVLPAVVLLLGHERRPPIRSAVLLIAILGVVLPLPLYDPALEASWGRLAVSVRTLAVALLWGLTLASLRRERGADVSALARSSGADSSAGPAPPEPAPPRRSVRRQLSTTVTWLAPLAVGAVVRLWNLPRQILLDDEMHTVGTALYVPVREILSSWKTEDPCLPLAALYRLLLESGVRFSEMTFRAPIVVFSLATILMLPWLARPLIGARAAVLWAWLLALSPVLAIYGGMVRPYAVIGLLAPAAALAILRWRESGRLRWGVSFAVLAALCLWFHLATAPLLVAPFGLLVIETVVARARGRAPTEEPRARPRDLAIAAVLAAALVGAFMVPAWQSLRDLYAAKSGIAQFSVELVPAIARLQAGASDGRSELTVTILFWCLAAVGFAVLAWRRAGVALYPAASALVQWVGLAILAPIGLLNPIIFNRYLIGTLPLVLLGVAAGLAEVTDRIAPRSSPAAGIMTPALLLALLVAGGPFADATFRRSSFQHSKDFIRFDEPRGKIDAGSVPPFYRDPSVREGGAAIIELPFRGGWSATRSHYVYQSIHRAPVIAAEPYGWPCDERLRLRNHVCSQPPALLASSARYLVVHRDPLGEESQVAGGDDSGNRYRPEEWNEFAQTAGRVTRGLRRRWGPPLQRDDRITVWDLDEVRRRVTEGPRASRSSPATH